MRIPTTWYQNPSRFAKLLEVFVITVHSVSYEKTFGTTLNGWIGSVASSSRAVRRQSAAMSWSSSDWRIRPRVCLFRIYKKHTQATCRLTQIKTKNISNMRRIAFNINSSCIGNTTQRLLNNRTPLRQNLRKDLTQQKTKQGDALSHRFSNLFWQPSVVKQWARQWLSVTSVRLSVSCQACHDRGQVTAKFIDDALFYIGQQTDRSQVDTQSHRITIQLSDTSHRRRLRHNRFTALFSDAADIQLDLAFHGHFDRKKVNSLHQQLPLRLWHKHIFTFNAATL
jgi:hypothetical protein